MAAVFAAYLFIGAVVLGVLYKTGWLGSFFSDADAGTVVFVLFYAGVGLVFWAVADPFPSAARSRRRGRGSLFRRR